MSNKEHDAECSGKGRKIAPALCRILGTLLMISVILFCIPMFLPRVTDYQVFHIVSGSMEPEISVGSMVLTEYVEPEEIQPGDIITFMREGAVVTHRVQENRFVEGVFITKGDANEANDMTPIGYQELIGRVILHVPMLGMLMDLFTTVTGKIYLGMYLCCGFLLHILADQLARR